jgi:hypothetical protein
MADKIKMSALMSRGKNASPTGRPLARGDEYEASAEQARLDARAGYGERIAETKTKAAKA